MEKQNLNDGNDSFIKNQYNDTKVQFNKIFVGGLSWETNATSLRNYFSQFDEVEDVIIMSDHKTGQPRGFGFVTMANTSAVNTIISMQHVIDKKEVDVKKAVPKEAKSLLTKSESNKIFVGGLPNDLKEKDLSQHFCKYGNIIDVIIMVDRNTNRSRGFGFVTFEKDEIVNMVLSQQIVINNKWIEVKRAEPRQNDLRNQNFASPSNIMQSYIKYQNMQFSDLIQYSTEMPMEYQHLPLSYINYNGGQYVQYYPDHDDANSNEFMHMNMLHVNPTRYE